ncbi:STAS domain-containing protein [Streptomyces sp. NBC_00138]|uniref:STAS domain-containing protein n=1 Tax=Streptomyces sp. NBC_00138 TaxID=2903625 RepID=UPI00325576DD
MTATASRSYEGAGRPVVVVDAGGLEGLGAVAALARLRLAARRNGRRLRLRGASPGLRALLELTGLAGEFEWEPEEGTEPLDVEE